MAQQYDAEFEAQAVARKTKPASVMAESMAKLRRPHPPLTDPADPTALPVAQ